MSNFHVLKGWFVGSFLVVGPSAFIYYLGIPYSAIYCLFFLLLIGFGTRVPGPRVAPWGWALLGFLPFTIVGGIYWHGDLMYVMPSLLCALMLLGVPALQALELKVAIDVYTKALVVLLFGAWLGFVLALLGFGPIVTFENPDGRSVGLYFSTLSNTSFNLLSGVVIRPSAIYDEPGAFSFYCVLGAFLCEVSGGLRRRAWTLLVLGLITGSVAHFIFLLIFSLYTTRKGVRVLLLAAMVAGVSWTSMIASNIEADQDVGGYILKLTVLRLARTDDGIAGDNRSELMKDAVSLIREKDLLFGIDSSCVSSVFFCKEKYGNFGENPLFPIVAGGIFGVGGLYIIGFIFLSYFSVVMRNYLLMMGLALMYLQRPYLFISPQYTLPLVVGCSLWYAVAMSRKISLDDRLISVWK